MTKRAAHIVDGVIANEASRYLIAAILGVSLSLSLPLFLHEILKVSPKVAVGAALTTVFFVNFASLRLFVFRSRSPLGRQFIYFGVSSAAFRIAEFYVFALIYDRLGWHYMVAHTTVLVVSFFIKYTFQKFVVFRR